MSITLGLPQDSHPARAGCRALQSVSLQFMALMKNTKANSLLLRELARAVRVEASMAALLSGNVVSKTKQICRILRP